VGAIGEKTVCYFNRNARETLVFPNSKGEDIEDSARSNFRRCSAPNRANVRKRSIYAVRVLESRLRMHFIVHCLHIDFRFAKTGSGSGAILFAMAI